MAAAQVYLHRCDERTYQLLVYEHAFETRQRGQSQEPACKNMKKKHVSLEDEKSKIELFLAENRKGLSTSLLTKT